MLSLHYRSIGSQVLCQVSDQVALDGHAGGVPGEAGGGGGIHPSGVVHEVGIEAAGLDLVLVQVPGQLMDNGTDHLQMSQFLRTYKRVKMEPEAKNARIARVSGAVSSRKHECTDSGIPVFHEYGAGWDTEKSEAGMAN